MKLRSLKLTDDLVAQILLTQHVAALAREGRIDWMKSDLERVNLADAVIAAVIEQSGDRLKRLPDRASSLAPVVEVTLRPKRRKRA